MANDHLSELFQPLRFPGDDYPVRFNITQLLQLCRLLAGIRQNSPELFNDPNAAMMELQLAHQAYLHQMRTGTDDERLAAANKLPEIRDKMLMICREMQRGG